MKDFTDNPRMRVAPETIYQAIYVQACGALKKEPRYAAEGSSAGHDGIPLAERHGSSRRWRRSGNAPPMPTTARFLGIGNLNGVVKPREPG